MLEKGFLAAREALKINAASRDSKKRHIADKQRMALDRIEAYSKRVLSEHGVSDIVPEPLDGETLLRQPTEILGLSDRVFRVLVRTNWGGYYDLETSKSTEGPLHTVGGLDKASDEDLLKVRNIGPKSLREIRDRIAKYKIRAFSKFPTNP